MEALTGLGRIEHRAEFALGNLSGARAEDIAGSDAEVSLQLLFQFTLFGGLTINETTSY